MNLSNFKLKYLVIALASQTGVVALNPLFADEISDNVVDSIVITGEKFDRNLKDTTTAVTVITEEDISTAELKDVNEVAANAPNVINSAFGSVSIRGIDGTGAATGGYVFRTGARSRVATIVDGVAQSWIGYNFTPSKLWDVRQVEVLKGPQSTTQGTNAIGGAMVSTTNDPTYDWESAVRIGAESYENGNAMSNAAVMLSGPIIEDELAFRLTVDGSVGESFITYEQDTTELDDSADVDDSNNLNFHGKLLWEPAALSGLSTQLTLNHQSYDGAYLTWINDEGFDDATYILSTANYANTRIQDSVSKSVLANIDYKFSDTFTNALLVSYGESDVEFEQYAQSFNVYSDTDNLVVDNRLLINAWDSKLAAVAGLYYSNTVTDQGVDIDWDNAAEVSTAAAYGEATYSLSDRFKLVAGARLENEQVERSATGGLNFEVESNENIFMPKAGVIYDVSDEVTVNASVRKGYNAGGEGYDFFDEYDWEYYTYDSETVVAYEAGLLSKFGTTQLAINAFFNDYSDYQALNTGDGIIENINQAQTYGVEAAGSLFVADGTLLRGSVGYTKSEVIDDSNDSTREGNELPNAPELDINAGVTHYITDDFSVGADVYYVGEYYSDLANTDDATAGDYMAVDLRAIYIWNDFEADIYVKNLTNENIITRTSGSEASIGQTHTVGFNLTYRM